MSVCIFCVDGTAVAWRWRWSRCVWFTLCNTPALCLRWRCSVISDGWQPKEPWKQQPEKKKKTNPKNNKIEPQQEAAAATFHFLRRIKAEAGAEQETEKREASRDWHGPCSTWQASSWRLFSKIKHSGLFSPAQAGSRAYGPQVKNKDNAHTLAYIMQRDPHLICKFPEILLNTFCSERIHLNLQLELSCIINEKRQFLAAA